MAAMETEPSPTFIDISPDSNGGITKTIITAGIEEDTPSNGCKVYVHYVGRLENGEQFDSSRERGQPFEFKLGEGNVIKGWDVGVATMMKNEVCELKIASEYAYGDKGFPPKIPADATLIFEIELLGWENEDITEDKDGGVLKLVVTEGTTPGKPNLEGSVKIHIRGVYEGRMFDERDVAFVIGDGYEHNIVQGIEIGVVTMRRYEKAKFFIKSEYGFKDLGCEAFDIPPHASEIVYEVVVFDFERVKEVYEMTYTEKLEKAQELKDRALKCIKAGEYEKAIVYYDRVLTHVKINKQDSDYHQCLPYKISAHCNAALCYLKTKDYIKAKTRAEKVLKYDDENVKAHFRLGEACLGTKDFAGAVRAYTEALKHDPNNTATKKQLQHAKMQAKKEVEYEKQLYSNIFKKMGEV